MTGWPGSASPAASSRRAIPMAIPEYRLEWQAMGSLDRRIRNCMVGVRAEPFAATWRN